MMRFALRMSSSPGLWIDGDLYNQFSMTGKTSGLTADIVLGWEDSHGGRDSVEEGELSTTYDPIPEFDLSSEWSGITIKNLWLGFRYTTSVTPQIRIGRVWLREAQP